MEASKQARRSSRSARGKRRFVTAALAAGHEPSAVPRTAYRRGRPRSEALKVAILRSARELFESGGPAAVTMNAVAERSKASRPTLYYWWPDRNALLMDALMEVSVEPVSLVSYRSGIEKLRQHFKTAARPFSTVSGRNVGAMIAAAGCDSALATEFREHFVLGHHNRSKELVQRAISTGEIARRTDVDAALVALYGGLLWLLTVSDAGADERSLERVFDQVLRGLK